MKLFFEAMYQIFVMVAIFVAMHFIVVYEMIFGEKRDQKGTVKEWLVAIYQGLWDLVRGKA